MTDRNAGLTTEAIAIVFATLSKLLSQPSDSAATLAIGLVAQAIGLAALSSDPLYYMMIRRQTSQYMYIYIYKYLGVTTIQ